MYGFLGQEIERALIPAWTEVSLHGYRIPSIHAPARQAFRKSCLSSLGAVTDSPAVAQGRPTGSYTDV